MSEATSAVDRLLPARDALHGILEAAGIPFRYVGVEPGPDPGALVVAISSTPEVRSPLHRTPDGPIRGDQAVVELARVSARNASLDSENKRLRAALARAGDDVARLKGVKVDAPPVVPFVYRQVVPVACAIPFDGIAGIAAQYNSFDPVHYCRGVRVHLAGGGQIDIDDRYPMMGYSDGIIAWYDAATAAHAPKGGRT